MLHSETLNKSNGAAPSDTVSSSSSAEDEEELSLVADGEAELAEFPSIVSPICDCGPSLVEALDWFPSEEPPIFPASVSRPSGELSRGILAPLLPPTVAGSPVSLVDDLSVVASSGAEENWATDEDTSLRVPPSSVDVELCKGPSVGWTVRRSLGEVGGLWVSEDSLCCCGELEECELDECERVAIVLQSEAVGAMVVVETVVVSSTVVVVVVVVVVVGAEEETVVTPKIAPWSPTRRLWSSGVSEARAEAEAVEAGSGGRRVGGSETGLRSG